jgi:hypothetical protein
MDVETLAEARQRAQDAMSRARLATDPDAKKRWEEAAREWAGRLARMKGGKADSTGDIELPSTEVWPGP